MALAREREPLYAAWAELSVDVTEPEETAETIIRLLKEAGP
jgi:hypothetical protein